MRVLEYGKANPKTMLFLPCTAEPEWAFTASGTLLAQDYHVLQIVYDGHGETGEDFISVEHTVEEIIAGCTTTAFFHWIQPTAVLWTVPV